MHPCGSAYSVALLLLIASKLGRINCDISPSSFSFVEVDSAFDASLGQSGEIEIVAPATTVDKHEKEISEPLQQPFEVVLGANLFPGLDYSNWAMCYAVFAHNSSTSSHALPASADGASESSAATADPNGAVAARAKPVLPPHCVAFSVVGDGVKFEPIGDPSPPRFDGLSSTVPYYSAVAWFESQSEPHRKWAVQERKFKVHRPIPKHTDGRAHFLMSDSGVPEFEDDVLLIDGVIRVSQNPLTHAAFKTTPTVCGALIAPEEENQIIKVAHAVEQVMTTLPMVRPIHLFHAPSLLDACTSISSGSDSSSFANEGGSAIQEDQSTNSQSGWTFPVGPLSITWKQSTASITSAAHTASGALSSSMNGRKGGGRGEAQNGKAAQVSLCHLVESEAVVPHALTVDSLSASERGNLLKSRVFWSRLEGSDRVLIFDPDSPSTTTTLTSTGGCVPSADQPSANYSASPKLIRDFATKFDFVNVPGVAATRDKTESSSRTGIAGQWSLRNTKLAASCATDYGHLVGDEDEAHFFERCLVARDGRIANATHHGRFRTAVCPW